MLRLRYSNEKIIFPKTIKNLNYLDVILSIFFYEEFSVFKYGMESSSFSNIIPKIIYGNYSEDYVHFVNEMRMTEKKNANMTPIPKSRNSMRKLSLADEMNFNGNIMFNMKKEDENCTQCNRLLKWNIHEKMEDFIDKFTVFTYNN